MSATRTRGAGALTYRQEAELLEEAKFERDFPGRRYDELPDWCGDGEDCEHCVEERAQ